MLGAERRKEEKNYELDTCLYPLGHIWVLGWLVHLLSQINWENVKEFLRTEEMVEWMYKRGPRHDLPEPQEKQSVSAASGSGTDVAPWSVGL